MERQWFDLAALARRGSRMGALLGLATVAFAAPAHAQLIKAEPPPVHSTIDANGGELVSGTYTMSVREVVIGQPSAGGLAYERTFLGNGWRDNVTGTINSAGSVYTVSLGASSETFTLASGVYASDQRRGSTLTFDATAQTYTYTLSDGTVAVFSKALGGWTPLQADEGRVTSITMPTGEKLTFTYKSGTVCVTVLSTCVNTVIARVQAVNSNLGYQLKFTYSQNTLSSESDITAFMTMTKVTGINVASNYCDPTADSCAGLPSTLPSITYATPGDNSMARTATDQMSRVTRYTYDANGRMTAIRRPSSSTDNITIAYNATTGLLSSVTEGSASWTYGYVDSSGVRTTTVTDPLSHSKTIVSNIATGLVTSETDALSHTTSYQYDAYGRRTRVTAPEGNYVQVTYDDRGNVTLTTSVAKSGSGLSNITTLASFDATCSNPITCNKPNTTTDERGKVTDYTYNATHGSVLTVTAPAPTTGADRPQTRYAYTALYAYYKNSSGTVVAAPTAVYRPTSVSSCATGTSCAGASNEVKTTIVYGSTGVANNLLPTSVSSGSGDGSLTATITSTYDNVGNLLTVDGPLSGTTDTTRYRYDNARQLIGVVGPEPDAGGTLKHRATRITYNADGQPTSSEQGTVNSQSDADWALFSVLEQTTAAYDTLGRQIKNTLVAGGSTQAVVQYSYDAANRLDCTALRMNPSVFGSLPTSACTLGTTGVNGADRITKNTWNNANQQTKVTTAYLTATARDEVTTAYTANGLQQTVTDAEGNKTTYEYDGFDRLKKIRYPSPTTDGTSSTTDYEEYGYDAASNVTSDRRRDGTTVTFGYDNLNRQTSGLLGATYAYDNLNRMTTATLSSVTTTLAWDALGRQTSETGPQGTVGYQYDLAGRRTRLTYPDSFYVTYDYNVAGDLTAIRENGAASGIGVLATYAWDNLGRRTSLTRGNGVITGYDYDPASRLDTLTQNLAGTAADTTFTLTHNAAGQVLSRTGTNSAYAPATQGALTRSYTANGLNQYSAVGGASISYDARGNLTGDGAKTYGYDVANRLTSVTGATLSYDVMGRLVQTTGASTTKFAYDGVDLIGEYNSGGTLLRRYVHGPAFDEPLVWYEGSGTTDRRWLVTDQLGSVISVTDGAGASTATNTYDAYGQPGTSNTGRFQYTGQTWLPEVELYHYKARTYSPALGRFMQTDPIGYGDGMNTYAYVGNDPANWVDPTGYAECPEQTDPTTDEEPPCVGEITVTAGDRCSVPGVQCETVAPLVYVRALAITYIYVALTPAADVLKQEMCLGARFDKFFRDNFDAASGVASQWNVDVSLLLGLSAQESGWGTSSMYRTQNNPFGATPGGDSSSGVSYRSKSAAWGRWGADWGARVNGVGSNESLFVSRLLQDNRAIKGSDRRGAYNSQIAPAGDPGWSTKVLGTIKGVRRRLPQWQAAGC